MYVYQSFPVEKKLGKLLGIAWIETKLNARDRLQQKRKKNDMTESVSGRNHIHNPRPEMIEVTKPRNALKKLGNNPVNGGELNGIA